MQNNKIKYKDAGMFTAYLNSLPRKERAEATKWIAQECGVSRQTVYSWRYMCSRIPEKAKKVIEQCAGYHVFSQIQIIFGEEDARFTDSYEM